MSLYNMLIGQDDYINQNVNRARSQYDAEIGNTIRTAGRMGINPNSGAFLNMLNNAQYERTAGMNAVGNDASADYLKMAQNQFNVDRNFAFKQKAFDAAQNQYWTNRMDKLNKQEFDRDSELAALRQKNKQLQELQNQQAQNQPPQNQQAQNQPPQNQQAQNQPPQNQWDTRSYNTKATQWRNNAYNRMFGSSPFGRGTSLMDSFAKKYYGR